MDRIDFETGTSLIRKFSSVHCSTTESVVILVWEQEEANRCKLMRTRARNVQIEQDILSKLPA